MATLQEQRQANGDRIAKERRANGERIQDQRRANGDRIEAERTGKAVADDINRLVNQPRQRRTLRPISPVGAVPASVGRGSYKEPAATTAGIASPITEPDYAAREWWPGGIPSTDGLLMLPAAKKIVAQDANGAEVMFEYAEPTP